MRFLIACKQFACRCVNTGGVDSFFKAYLHLISYAAEAYIRVFSLDVEIVIEIGILNVSSSSKGISISAAILNEGDAPQKNHRLISRQSYFITVPQRNRLHREIIFKLQHRLRLWKADPDYCRYNVIKHAVKINTVSDLEYLTLRANTKFRSALRFPNEIHKQIFIRKFRTRMEEVFRSANLSRQRKRFKRNSIYSCVRELPSREPDLEFASPYMVYITSTFTYAVGW